MTTPTQDFDPFSLVYTALWRMVERNQTLLRYIPVGNRVKFDENSDAKAIIESGDTPELKLLTGGGTFQGEDNKDRTTINRNYIWAVTTGDFRLNENFNRICFELYRSMIDWECTLCQLEWCGCKFVDNFRLTDAEDGTLLQDLNRGIPGWSTLWNCEVKFTFVKSHLRIR